MYLIIRVKHILKDYVKKEIYGTRSIEERRQFSKTDTRFSCHGLEEYYTQKHVIHSAQINNWLHMIFYFEQTYYWSGQGADWKTK